MGPIRFREQKIGDIFAFGRPRSSCVRHACVLRYATHPVMAPTNDLTPYRMPYVSSPPAIEPQTPTKHPALRLRGGRRTPLRCRSVSCAPSWLPIGPFTGRGYPGSWVGWGEDLQNPPLIQEVGDSTGHIQSFLKAPSDSPGWTKSMVNRLPFARHHQSRSRLLTSRKQCVSNRTGWIGLSGALTPAIVRSNGNDRAPARYGRSLRT